jgi:hypothetical protein
MIKIKKVENKKVKINKEKKGFKKDLKKVCLFLKRKNHMIQYKDL